MLPCSKFYQSCVVQKFCLFGLNNRITTGKKNFNTISLLSEIHFNHILEGKQSLWNQGSILTKHSHFNLYFFIL